MMKIKMLNRETIEKIAAGEVIVRPASVVKELIENAIDAGSTRVAIIVEKGGKKRIRVTDNGAGIRYHEIPLAFTRHATSKLSTISDLNTLESLGFRGEALASIAAVSRVVIKTIAFDEEMGSETLLEGGRVVNQRVMPFNRGTDIDVSDLFYNVPARQKHMQKDKTEGLAIHDLMERLALSHPEIAFTYAADGRRVFSTPGSGDLSDVIACLYGRGFLNSLHPIEAANAPMRLTGYIGDLTAMRSSRDRQIFFMNNRIFENKALSRAFETAYEGYLMHHKHPVGIVFIELPGKMLDVNMHPAKMEIGILNQSLVDILFRQGIRTTVRAMDLTVDLGKAAGDEPPVAKSVPTEEVQAFEEAPGEQLQIKEQTPFWGGGEKAPTTPRAASSLETPAQKSQPPRQSPPVKPPNGSPEAAAVHESLQGYEAAEAGRPRLDLSDAAVIGQLFKTFVILEKGREVILIDQHAAHEAFMFEQYRKQFMTDAAADAQTLMVPEPVDISAKLMACFEELKPALLRGGYDCDVFGDTTLMVRSVPLILGEPQPATLVPLWMEALLTGDRELREKRWLKVATMACKAAVKGNQDLTPEEIQALIDGLMRLENLYTCPHGRPIILHLSQYELEKLFKRVVS
jgi:DNA mismatch repair protein MutL